MFQCPVSWFPYSCVIGKVLSPALAVLRPLKKYFLVEKKRLRWKLGEELCKYLINRLEIREYNEIICKC